MGGSVAMELYNLENTHFGVVNEIHFHSIYQIDRGCAGWDDLRKEERAKMKKPPVLPFLLSLILALVTGCAPASPQPAVSSPAVHPSVAPTATSSNGSLLPVRGLYVQFERRGWHEEYWSGQVLQLWNTTDQLLGHTVREEVALQLDEMVRMGVNTITFELRSSSPESKGNNFVPPNCPLPPVLGMQYPQPTPLELENLVQFYDLVQSKGIRIHLRLMNTHMEEQPPTGNAQWIGSILKVIKDHPAFDLVLFEGFPFMVDTTGDGAPDRCGPPVEPPLWDGPGSVSARYIEWAVQYGHSLGIPYRKLSAEAIIGDYYAFSQGPSGPEATDSHQWDPVFTLKTIFDNLNIPDAERAYALSWYEHPKCMTARELPCQEIGPHAWAIETAQHVYDVIGHDSQARVVVPEMGLHTNASVAEWNWTTEQALESLVWIMQQHGMEGGSFWRWTDFFDYEEHDPRLAIPVKKRGTDFVYNPVADVLQQLYTVGYVANSSFDPAAEATAAAETATSVAATVEAKLAAPLDDSFDAPELDSINWLPETTPGASLATDGALTLFTDGTQPSAGASIASKWLFTGDFDMQVEWQLGDDYTAPQHDHVDAAFLAVGSVSPDRYWITRIGLPGDVGQFMAFSEASGQIGEPVETQARAGKFRITRTGDLLTFYYDVGNGWQKLQSVLAFTGPMQIRMGMASISASLSFTTHFDNFRVNFGSVEHSP